MERRRFLKLAGLGAASYCLPGWKTWAAEESAGGGVVLTDLGSDRATAYACSNKIIRRKDHLFVGWLEAPEKKGAASLIRVGVCDAASGALQKTLSLGEGKDNHCGPALALDGNSRLHIVIGGHHTKLSYRYSDDPENQESWSQPEQVGTQASYPSLIVDAKNVLHLAWRDAIGSYWRLLYSRKAPGGSWESPTEMVACPDASYANFAHSLSIGPDGRLHLIFQYFYSEKEKSWTEGRGRSAGYVYSNDGGSTWLSGAKKCPLPITEQSGDFIFKMPAEEPGIGLGLSNHVVDREGKVWLLINIRGRKQGLVFRGGEGGWTEVKMDSAFQQLNFSGGTTVSLSRTPDNEIVMALPMDPSGAAIAWGASSAALLELKITEAENQQSITPLTQQERDRSSWLPAYELWDWVRKDTCCQGGPWLAYTRGVNAKNVANILKTEVRLMHPKA